MKTEHPRPVPLDALDHRLMALLQEDASRSNQDLAEAAHVSPATALRRVRRLREAGVIERVVALVAPDAVGPGLTALVEVTLDRQGAEHLDAFEAVAVGERARAVVHPLEEAHLGVSPVVALTPGPRCRAAGGCQRGRA